MSFWLKFRDEDGKASHYSVSLPLSCLVIFMLLLVGLVTILIAIAFRAFH